jgi:hypothetical protein
VTACIAKRGYSSCLARLASVFTIDTCASAIMSSFAERPPPV